MPITTEALYAVLAVVGIVWASLLIGAFIYWRGTLRNNPFPKMNVVLPTFASLLPWNRTPSKRLERMIAARDGQQAEIEAFIRKVRAKANGNNADVRFRV